MRIDVDLHGIEPAGTVEGEETEFARHEPDLARVREKAEAHELESLVVVGNGGSVTSFRALAAALPTEVDTEIVDTMDPARLRDVAERHPQDGTVVMPVSKSGSTVGVLEAFLYLRDRGFPGFAVTSDNDGALREIVRREGLDWLEHPPLGGRFSGASETGLVPAAFAGMDVTGIREGAERAHAALRDGGAAADLARGLYAAEKDGFDAVFAGFYAWRLRGFRELLVQLMHETVCKAGEGQTVLAAEGPEFQHHTNQRIFGGRQDLFPLFVTVQDRGDGTVDVPGELADVEVRGRELGDLDGEDLDRALSAEEDGVRRALEEAGRPYAAVELPEVTPETVGELLALFQYAAVYSARLRGVDPFTQPDVERAKELGFAERF